MTESIRKRTDAQIFRIALPAIVSNLTVPLLSLVDMAIVGHIGNPSAIGAIAVGGTVFNMVYWLFGFLRMGTGGMGSQALGARDLPETKRILLRALSLAAAAGVVMIAAQAPLKALAFWIIGPSGEVATLAGRYFGICIWGAPAVLALYCFNGWFLGMQNTRFPMYVALTQNVLNIAASLAFVFWLGMDIEGVALGTLLAQWAGALMSALLYRRFYTRVRRQAVKAREIRQPEALRRFFSVNRDIFLRTLCLVGVTLFFTSAGARQGELTLAANALLMQFFTIYSYLMDGFAYAGEALCGRYYGACNAPAFRSTVSRLFLWGGLITVFCSVVYGLADGLVLRLLTNEAGVLEEALRYSAWMMLVPPAGMAAFLLDGVFIGTTSTRQMLVSIACAAALFLATFFSLSGLLGNNALWLAFILYLAVRGIVLGAFLPRQWRPRA